MSAPAPPARRFSLSLVALLAAVAFVELIVNRVVRRLVHLKMLHSGFTELVDVTGRLLFAFTSVLSVLVLAAALVRVALAGSEFRVGARVSFPLVGAVFVALGSVGAVLTLPDQLAFHLHVSFLFLSLLLTLAALASPAPGRVRVGATLLMLALAARVVPSLLARAKLLPPLGPIEQEASTDALLVTLGVAGFCLLPKRGGAGVRTAALATWPLICFAAILIRRDWDTAARVAAYGFAVDLPLDAWGQLLCLGVLASGIYATARLLVLPGVHRLRGFGFLLLMLGGMHLELPYLTLCAIGLLCIAQSAARIEGRPIARDVFERVVRHGAGAVGTPQVTLTGEPGYETARLHSPAESGAPVAVTLARKGGVVAEVEVTVGEAPPRDPPFTVVRRASRGLGPAGSGARVETEDPAFDREFEIHDTRGVGAPLLDDDTRARLGRVALGWLAVWPQRGVRYRATELPDGDDALAALIALCRELASRTA